MSILITICARGGSKGLPDKNIKVMHDRPLIGYTIRHAEEFSKRYKDVDIALSTDSSRIKKVAEMCGLKSDYIRPDYLANDTAGKMGVLDDILNYQEKKYNKKYDFILDLDVTSPLRTMNDLDKAYQIFVENTEALNIFSVSKPNRNPYFNVVEPKTDGYCKLVKYSDSLSRQMAPTVYDMNASFYFYRRTFFNLGLKSTITEKSLYYLMDHVCFDIDEPIDFDVMEYLIKNNKLGFEI